MKKLFAIALLGIVSLTLVGAPVAQASGVDNIPGATLTKKHKKHHKHHKHKKSS